MICHLIKRFLPLYIADELPMPFQSFIERHVSECERCQAELEKYARLSDWIAEARKSVNPECGVSWERVESVFASRPMKPAHSNLWWATAPVAVGVIAFALIRFTVNAPVQETAVKPAEPPITTAQIVPPIQPPKLTVNEPNVETPKSTSPAVKVQARNTDKDKVLILKPKPEPVKKTNAPATDAKKAEPKSTSRDDQTSTGKVTEINIKEGQADSNEAQERDSSEIIWSY